MCNYLIQKSAVVQGSYSGVGQTEYYADFKKYLGNTKTEVVNLINLQSQKCVLSTQLIYNMPQSSMSIKEFLIECIKGRKNGMIELMDGPVYLEPDEKINATKELFSYIEMARKKHNIKVVRMQNSNIDSEVLKSKEIQLCLKKYEIRRWATLIIDLSLDSEDLFKKLKHAARKNIKKCNSLEMEIQEITSLDDYKNVFWKSYSEFEASYGRQTHSFEIEETAWKANKYGNAKYYVAKKSNEVLATLGLLYVGDTATEIASSINPICHEQKIAAQDFIHWYLILEAKRKEYKKFNLAGINPNPRTAKEEGIRRFKEKWGGEYKEYYDLFMEPFFVSLLKKIYFFLKK